MATIRGRKITETYLERASLPTKTTSTAALLFLSASTSVSASTSLPTTHAEVEAKMSTICARVDVATAAANTMVNAIIT